MTPIRTFTTASLPMPSMARGGNARVEKISLSSKLHGERDDNTAPESFAEAKLARMRAFHNETSHGVSQMDALRLVPTFVTQVFAQVAGAPTPDTASALLAYGHGGPQIARVYDRNA
jgi:hypothetical protein